MRVKLQSEVDLMLRVGRDLILEDAVLVDDPLQVYSHLDGAELTQQNALHYYI